MKKLSILVIAAFAMLAIGCTFSELFPIPVERPSKDEEPDDPASEGSAEDGIITEPQEGDIGDYFPEGFLGISYEEGVYSLHMADAVHTYSDGDTDYFGARNSITMEISGDKVTFTRSGYDPLIFILDQQN